MGHGLAVSAHYVSVANLMAKVSLMPDACVLLTGATGLVGGDLLALLSKRMPAAGRIVVLTRRDPLSLAPNGRVVIVSGDLALPDLGLAPETYRELQCKLTAVLHCAAAT